MKYRIHRFSNKAVGCRFNQQRGTGDVSSNEQDGLVGSQPESWFSRSCRWVLYAATSLRKDVIACPC